MKRQILTNTEEGKKSWLHQIRLLLGFTFVPDKKVRVLKRDEQYFDILETGYHYIFRFRNSLGPEISTGMRTVKPANIECWTSDGVRTNVNTEVLYSFNPANCVEAVRPELALNSQYVGIMVERITQYVTRLMLGQYAEKELRSGNRLSEFQARITRRFNQVGASLGVTLIQHIALTNMHYSDRIENLNEVARGYANLADEFHGLPTAVQDHIFAVERVRALGNSGAPLRVEVSEQALTPQPQPSDVATPAQTLLNRRVLRRPNTTASHGGSSVEA